MGRRTKEIVGILSLLMIYVFIILLLSRENYQGKVKRKREYLEMWENWIETSGRLPVNLSVFKTVLILEEMVLLLDMLQEVTQTLEKFNLIYFMDGGTLLGSYLHHGFIPWDDDVDIMAEYEEKKLVLEALNTLKEKYTVSALNKAAIKIYPRKNSKVIPKFSSWKWPFMDILWFTRRKDHIIKLWDNSHYDIVDIFPLKKCPFAHLTLLSPSNVPAYLNLSSRSWRMCSSHGRSHKANPGIGRKWTKVKCSELLQYYPTFKRDSN